MRTSFITRTVIVNHFLWKHRGEIAEDYTYTSGEVAEGAVSAEEGESELVNEQTLTQDTEEGEAVDNTAV